MKRTLLFLIALLGTLLGSSAQTTGQPTISSYVEISTSYGKIVVGLYDDTPLHRDNFLQLVHSGSYDGVIFHRVIDRFMIQTGNLNTRHASTELDVNTDTLSRQIEAEILLPHLFHKRGALCAAREPDEVNPEKRSSGSQFYIVTGTFYTDYDLDVIEKNEGRTFTPEQREAYKMSGGTPYLDGEYTVFGEVVKGIEVVGKIERAKTDTQNRPKKNIFIKQMKQISFTH